MLAKFLSGIFALKPSRAPEDSSFKRAFHLYQNGDLVSCLRICNKLTEHHPEHAEAWHLLGVCLLEGGLSERALPALERAAELKADDTAVLRHAISAAKRIGRTDDLMRLYRQSLAVNPDQADILNNLGLQLMEMGSYHESLDCLLRSLAICEAAQTHHNIGALYLRIGRVDKALASFNEALRIKPDLIDTLRARLSALMYLIGTTDQEIRNTSQEFGRACSVLVHPMSRPPKISLSASRMLRIGYLSSDFRRHPVSENMIPILQHHDKSRFQIYAYADVARPDEVTKEIQNLVDVWRDVKGLSDEAVAQAIRHDEIDILVLLAWRLDRNRPLIAAYRAAPIQINYHDPGTTGQSAMDYIITDITMIPRHSSEWFSERPFRLPNYYIRAPLASSPDPGPPPCITSGVITFSCFNNPAKLNASTVHLWARILKELPRARIRFKYQDVYSGPDASSRIISWFEQEGISAHRLDFISEKESPEEHLARYQQIDIALDTYPFTGSTTTFEALWMSVPVITWAGTRMASRWSASILRAVGLSDLVADNSDDYVRLAVELAQDKTRLVSIREQLRKRVRNSPICAAARGTRHLERFYRVAWRKWCLTAQYR